jgi:hypothetical protein
MIFPFVPRIVSFRHESAKKKARNEYVTLFSGRCASDLVHLGEEYLELIRWTHPDIGSPYRILEDIWWSEVIESHPDVPRSHWVFS